MEDKFLFICRFSVYFSLIQTTFSVLEDVTNDVGLRASSQRVLSAFGDFNSDKKADMFMKSNLKDKSIIEVLLWDEGDDMFKTDDTTIQLDDAFTTNIIPGDFDGDGDLDILVSYYDLKVSPKESQTFVKVFLAKNSKFDGKEIKIDDILKDQPAIVDFDGDLHPDLLGEKIDGKRYWWKYVSKSKTFESRLILTENGTHLSKPHSSAFLDLNNDYIPDIFLPISKDSSPQKLEFEVMFNKEGEFNTSEIYEPKSGLEKETVFGQSTFADIDSDGVADQLLPVCYSQCSKSEILVYSNLKKKWVSILRTSEDLEWNFVNQEESGHIPLMTIRIGDYNLDGYPDAAVVVDINIPEKSLTERRVVLLENVGCKKGSVNCHNGRKFDIEMRSVLSSIQNPLLVGFFDLYDNGVLDIIAVSSNGTSYKTHAIQNKVYSDTCFLKVIVLGSSCFSSCPSGSTPYGVNQAGPYVKYLTTSPSGHTKQSSATQLSQASYVALQPPYVVFGLGRTPNFLEKLIIGLPRSTTSPVRKHTWLSIIPNAQVIIIPYPPNEPSEWKWKLLLTPSRLAYLTGGALLATCVFIGGIVGLLHWKEKREDRKEKQQAAHKFHFDAM